MRPSSPAPGTRNAKRCARPSTSGCARPTPSTRSSISTGRCAIQTIRLGCCRSTIVATTFTRATWATARWETRSICRCFEFGGGLDGPLPTVVARRWLAPPCLPPEQDCAGKARARTTLLSWKYPDSLLIAVWSTGRGGRGRDPPRAAPMTLLRRGRTGSGSRCDGDVLQHAALIGLGEHGFDGLHELSRRIHAQLHGHAGTRAEGLVDEVDVERVLERQIVRMVVGDVGLADLEPLRAALPAARELHLVGDHRAHG